MTVDLFVVAGQSNARGRGDSAESPSVAAGVGWDVSDGTVTALADPVGPADTGSAWPSFVNTLHGLTGRPVAICSVAVSGSAMVPEADNGPGDWSPTGLLFPAAIRATRTAISALTAAGLPPILRGVLWAQGERDAGTGGATRALYPAAIAALPGRLQQALGVPNLPVWMIRTGTLNDGDTDGFAEIRGFQDAAAAADPDLVMAYTGTVDFPGLGYMGDNVHYDQDGLDVLGAAVAGVVAERLRLPMRSMFVAAGGIAVPAVV